MKIIFSVLVFMFSVFGNAYAESDSVYERIIETGIIRAAYISYPPGSIVEPGTKNVTGVFPELLNKIGENTKLKVEFTEEVGWSQLIEGLETGRYDIIGTPVWANPIRGKLATLSKPVYYTGIGIWVRPDESRFSNIENINNSKIKIAAMDGSTPMLIAKAMFPKAQLVSYPDTAGEQQIFLDITSKKADVFFAEPAIGLGFLKNNPDTIKDIADSKPIKVFPNVFMMKKGEWQLKQMIDTALHDLETSGYAEKIIDKYDPNKELFLRLAKPYIVE
jgi:ABC-type amino acid transport substrate-binding protein